MTCQRSIVGENAVIANDTVEEMNLAFLRKSASDKCLLNGLKLTDVFETNCALSPVNRFPAAYKTWAMRTHFLNASYFTTTTPLRVACPTSLVAAPTHIFPAKDNGLRRQSMNQFLPILLYW